MNDENQEGIGQVTEEFPDSGDLSTQVGGDTIEAAKGVLFNIENVEKKLVKDENTGEVLLAKLNVRASIGPQGVDGQGKYAGKNMFIELITWVNEEKYTSDWWKNTARFPYKSFLKAMKFNPAQPPKVTDEFIVELKGQGFIADVTREEIEVKTSEVNEKGKPIYAGTGDYKNVLKNFKSVEKAA